MCQLLGMNCNIPTDICFSFTGFQKRGGGTDVHADDRESPSSEARVTMQPGSLRVFHEGGAMARLDTHPSPVTTPGGV